MRKRLTVSHQESGTHGPHVVKALLQADFDVTVLTPSKAGASYDAKVKVAEVDYGSVDSLTSTLKVVDAVVSAVAGQALENQTVLIDAAAAAGVKRFIPSEYGSCTTSPKVENLPFYSSAFKIRKHLQAKATAGDLTWTVLACGAFLEFVFIVPRAVDWASHKATLLDEGDNKVSSTSMPNVGKAVAAILKHSEATKNKVVRVSEVIVTQNGLVKIAQEVRPDVKWETTKLPSKELLQQGLDGLGKGDFSMPTIMKIIGGTAFGGRLLRLFL